MSQKSIAAALEILRTNDAVSLACRPMVFIRFIASLGYVLFDPERAYREVELLLEAR